MTHYLFYTQETADGTRYSFDNQQTWHASKLKAFQYALRRGLLTTLPYSLTEGEKGDDCSHAA